MRSLVEELPAVSRTTASREELLIERVSEALDRCGYGQLRRVRVTARPTGRVRLEGLVSSFYLKQVAQTAALSVRGVIRVHNDLQVSAGNSVACS